MSISVVMTVFNGQRFLADAIRSVLAQTMRNFELIVVDDGSTDASPAILRRFASRDPRIRILRQENGGVPRAANAGIRAARYDWIARSDADDRMLPDRLERQWAFLRDHPSNDVLCSYCYFIDASGKRIGSSARPLELDRGKREFRPSLFLELTNSTVLMRKEAFFGVGGYRDLAYAEDRDLWGRLATAGCRMACQPEFLEEFRLHGGCLTMRNAALQHELCGWIDLNVVRRLQGAPELTLPEFRQWRRNQPLRARLREMRGFGALHAFKRASRHYGERRYGRCALTIAAAVCLDPARIFSRVISRLGGGEPQPPAMTRATRS
jgi:glycosyltransferase involved in cell wall biosynthesis